MIWIVKNSSGVFELISPRKLRESISSTFVRTRAGIENLKFPIANWMWLYIQVFKIRNS